MMQSSMTLYNLFDNCPDNSSNITYDNGTKITSITFVQLRENLDLVSSFLNSFLPSKCTVCCLIRPSLSLPALMLGILKLSSSFAFLDYHKPYESLLCFQKYLSIKTLFVEECYLQVLESKLCSCWKKSGQLMLISTYTAFHSTECKNVACPNSKNLVPYQMEHDIAYAIQTSGTTGEPKVVQVPHQCIVPNIIDFKSRFSVSANDVILQSTKITFDPSIIEIFVSLTSGASLIMVDNHVRSIPKKLGDVIRNNSVTILQATPSLISNLGENFIKDVLLHKNSTIRVLAFGGEICPSWNKLQRWKSSENNTEIYNLYGLTEVSCWASCFKIDLKMRKSMTSIPLGEPLLNTKLDIRSESGDAANIGELYVGGYNRFCIINDEKWPENSNEYMRATGDLVYKDANGMIYFEGRRDCLIKYKGHKISLQLLNNTVESISEIENHFLHFDSTSQIFYLFVVLNSSSLSSEYQMEHNLVKEIRRLVPSLPVISVVSVPFIPVTQHGKGDSEKLMTLVRTKKKRPVSIASYEDVIRTFWKDYTKHGNIEEADNFILNGGDSISAIQFAADIEWEFQLSLPMLVDKLLNESFKDVISFIKLSLKDCYPHHVSDFSSSDLSNQPLMKKICSNFNCFKLSCKQGYFENCSHSTNSCFPENSSIESFISTEVSIKLLFKCDMKKCIDATPCVLLRLQSGKLSVFIGSHFGMFSCININEQAEVWHILLPDRIESSACISACGNYVLFGCYDHYLYCLHITNGEIHWKLKTNGEVKCSPSVSSNNLSFVGSHDKHIYAVDIESGNLVWKKQLAGGSIFASPSVIEKLQVVCIATLDGVLAFLKMISGDILWKYDYGKPLFSSPLTAFDFIFIGSTDNSLLCIDFDGNLKFKFSTNGPVFSSASFHNSLKEEQLVFGCHDCCIYSISLTGNLLWKTVCDSPVYATPFVFKRNCYYVCAASSKGTLYILQQSDGKVLHSWDCPGEVFSSPIVFDDYVVVGCRDNNVYIFNLINYKLS